VPLFVEVPPTTAADRLVHVTWADEWRPVLARFGAACPAMPPAARVPHEQPGAEGYEQIAGGGDALTTWTLGDGAFDGEPDLEAGMRRLADAFFEWSPPASALILTGLLDELPDGGCARLIGFLHDRIVELTGDPNAAIAAPVGMAGGDDGGFAPHSDMWVPALLFNVFESVDPEGRGATLLIAMEDVFPIAEAAGVPREQLDLMREALAAAGREDYYVQFNGALYDDEHPWKDEVERRLIDASLVVPLGRGQGYLANDREWLHGRTPLPLDFDRENRLFRLAYDNAAARSRAAVQASG
jgi:hypothetical protein